MVIESCSIYDSVAKLWQGPPPEVPLHDPNCSVGRLLFDAMKLRPKATALISDSEQSKVTYAELLSGSIRVAQMLQNLALKQDDIVGIVSEQLVSTIYLQLACWFNATPFHAINPANEEAVLEHLFGITCPKLIFCGGKFYPMVSMACEALQLNATIYVIDKPVEGVASLMDILESTSMEDSYKPVDLLKDESQTVCIINSSGTSGRPKAVCLSNNIMSFKVCELEESDITLTFSPLDWLTATIFTVATILAGATRVITTTPYTPAYLVQLLEKYRVTCMMLSPTDSARLLKFNGVEQADFSSLRLVFTGGSTMPAVIYRNLRKLLKDESRQRIKNCYGSSEFGGVVTQNTNAEKPTAVGKLLPGCKIRIVDEDGKYLGAHEVGEILLYNGKNWNGYYGNPEETAKMQDVDMWMHSGDLGYFDEDGDLFIVDRKKDIMKYRNVQYSPQEIEDVIAELPDVIEVCVFGNTNETEGDRPAAAIVRRPESELTEPQVVHHVAERFPVEWKRLHGGVFFLECLPKTGNGKIIRRDTKTMALRGCGSSV